MSLIPHDDLKEILASMNIDFKYIDKMIERSHSFNKVSEVFSSFELKTEGMDMDEIKTLIKIYRDPDSFKNVVPEYFIEGPSNIPNFSERFTLTKMIAI